MQEAEASLAPDALINEQGAPQFGVYYRPIETINLTDFDYRKVAPFPMNLSTATSRGAIKRWQYMGFASSQVVVGMAVVDIGYAHTAFIYIYNRVSGKLHDMSYIDPLRRKATLSESSLVGVSQFVSGKKVLRMDNHSGMTARSVFAHIPETLRLEIETDEAAMTPLCAVTRDGLNGYNYCHKAAGFPIKGFVEIHGERFEFNGDDSHGALDWTAGCLGRNTFWNWASGGGRLKDGRRLGINLVSGVNERPVTENVFWVHGKPIKVDVVNFDYDRDAILTKPWRIRSNDGRVDLSFQADSERTEDINLGLVISRFHQPFGQFEGRLEIDGLMQDVSLYGMVEEHQARW